MSLWSRTSVAINKGWGIKPFSVHPPAIHPEYLMKGPYGTIPFKGGMILRPPIVGPGGLRPPIVGPGGTNPETRRRRGERFLLSLDKGHRETQTLPQALRRRKYLRGPLRSSKESTLRPNFDHVRHLNKLKDIWQDQQIASETTFFDTGDADDDNDDARRNDE